MAAVVLVRSPQFSGFPRRSSRENGRGRIDGRIGISSRQVLRLVWPGWARRCRASTGRKSRRLHEDVAYGSTCLQPWFLGVCTLLTWDMTRGVRASGRERVPSTEGCRTFLFSTLFFLSSLVISFSFSFFPSPLLSRTVLRGVSFSFFLSFSRALSVARPLSPCRGARAKESEREKGRGSDAGE